MGHGRYIYVGGGGEARGGGCGMGGVVRSCAQQLIPSKTQDARRQDQIKIKASSGTLCPMPQLHHDDRRLFEGQ